jgi:uncharacterized protein
MILEESPSSENSRSLGLTAAACLLALGISAGGYFVGYALKGGLAQLRAPHTIAVKGLAERAVKADLALWPLRFVTASNDLATAQTKIEADQKAITDFLKAQGLPDDAITIQRTDVIDLKAREYRNENLGDTRYIVYGNIMIRSNNVDTVQTIGRNLTEPVKAGVVFTTEGVGQPASLTPYFLFTRLNDVKTEMLAESTKNALTAARQLADDSGTLLGSLAKASQGTFSILPGDSYPGASEETQITKTVRVVSTFEYSLGN